MSAARLFSVLGRVDRVRLFLSGFPGRIELGLIKTTTGNTELILLAPGSGRASGGFL